MLFNRCNLVVIFCLLLGACQTMNHQPIKTVDYVDLNKFMGDWYVIAHVPTLIDDDAYNAVESYALNEDGSIATTFRFRAGSFDGKLKTYHPTGYVSDTQSNSVWGMQFIWPIKADYRIMSLSDDYSLVIVARNKRDYVWIMARSPKISEQAYQDCLAKIKQQGYSLDKIRRIPQQWPESNS